LLLILDTEYSILNTNLMNPFTWIKNQSLFNDRRAVSLLILCAVVLVFIIIYSVVSIESRDFKVPIRYSGYREGNLSNRGEWYSLYTLPLFAAVTFGFNFILSLKVHRMRPELSHVLLGLNLVIAAFTYFVAKALFNLL